jgi:MerR HTH family regulatory protein
MGRKIRISELALATGCTIKQLSLWSERHEHIRPTAPQTGGRFEFSFADVAIFSIAKYLVELGVPVAAAFTYAKAVVQTRWPGLFDVEDPHWQVTAHNAVIDLHYGPSTHFEDIITWGISSIEPEATWARLKRGLDAVGSKEFPARVIITVHLSHIIIDAFAKLVDMDHKAPRQEENDPTVVDIPVGLRTTEKRTTP